MKQIGVNYKKLDVQVNVTIDNIYVSAKYKTNGYNI